MDDHHDPRVSLARRRTSFLVVVLACAMPIGAAAVALAVAGGMLAEPGFATAVAVTALILLLG